MPSNLETIKEYYEKVDVSLDHTQMSVRSVDKHIDALLSLFSDDAVYERQGYEPFMGKEAIRDFFAAQRALVGTHTLLSVEEKSGLEVNGHALPDSILPLPADVTTIVVQGVFHGRLLHNTVQNTTRQVTGDRTANLSFTDYWVMHEGKALYRYSEITPMRFVAPKSEAVVRY